MPTPTVQVEKDGEMVVIDEKDLATYEGNGWTAAGQVPAKVTLEWLEDTGYPVQREYTRQQLADGSPYYYVRAVDGGLFAAVSPDGVLGESYASLTAAKSACQTDYDARF